MHFFVVYAENIHFFYVAQCISLNVFSYSHFSALFALCDVSVKRIIWIKKNDTEKKYYKMQNTKDVFCYNFSRIVWNRMLTLPLIAEHENRMIFRCLPHFLITRFINNNLIKNVLLFELSWTMKCVFNIKLYSQHTRTHTYRAPAISISL